MRLDQVFGILVILLAIYLGVQASGAGSVDSTFLDTLRSRGTDGGTFGDGGFTFGGQAAPGDGQLGVPGDAEDADGSRATRDDGEDADGSGVGRDDGEDADGVRAQTDAAEVGRRARVTTRARGGERIIVTSSFCAAAPTRSDYVDLGSAHDAAIRCMVAAGVMTGTSDTQFDPRTALTRGQAAASIAAMIDAANRLEADNVDLRALPSADDARFEDVTPATPHEMAIARLNETPILRGYVDARYEPDGKVTRAQMASMLDRAYQYVNRAALPIGPDRFSDDDRSVHEESINAVTGANIMYGVSDSRFAPHRSVRRGQMASYLARMMVRMEDKGRIRPLPSA